MRGAAPRSLAGPDHGHETAQEKDETTNHANHTNAGRDEGRSAASGSLPLRAFVPSCLPTFLPSAGLCYSVSEPISWIARNGIADSPGGGIGVGCCGRDSVDRPRHDPPAAQDLRLCPGAADPGRPVRRRIEGPRYDVQPGGRDRLTGMADRGSPRRRARHHRVSRVEQQPLPGDLPGSAAG